MLTATRPSASGAANTASAVGLVGLGGWLVALALDPVEAMRAWLTAWAYGLMVALGALGLVSRGHATRPHRRARGSGVAEAIAMSTPGVALGAVPIVLGAGLLELEPAATWAGPVAMLVGACILLAVIATRVLEHGARSPRTILTALLAAQWVVTYGTIVAVTPGAAAAPGWEHAPALAAVLGLGAAYGASMRDRRLFGE